VQVSGHRKDDGRIRQSNALI